METIQYSIKTREPRHFSTNMLACRLLCKKLRAYTFYTPMTVGCITF